MPSYIVTPRFRKQLRKKPVKLQGAILECIARLEENPRHPGLQTHQVGGTGGVVWEAYVDAANRVTFHWDAGMIVLRNHCNHDIIRRSP